MAYGNYPDLSLVKRILVIKMRHHGDVLLTSPLFTHLKKAMPDAEIDAFIYKDTLPMLEGHPAISSYLLYDRGWKKLSLLKKIGKEIGLLRHIRSKGYDLVINLTEGDRGAIAATVSKAKYRVGFDPKGSGFFGKRKAFTHVVKSCPHPRHTVERQLDALRRIGIFPSEEERELYLHIPEEAKHKVLSWLQPEEIRPGDYILFHPVSRWRFKCLAPKQVAALLSTLCAKGMRLVMSAGPDDQEIAMVQEILSLVPDVPVLNLAGKLTLKELSALIAMSKALLCVDSVPLHIASATQTPVVVMFGPTSDQNWGPWMHPKAEVVTQALSCRPCYQDGCGGSKMSDCLYRISQNAMLEGLEKVLVQYGRLSSTNMIVQSLSRK